LVAAEEDIQKKLSVILLVKATGAPQTTSNYPLIDVLESSIFEQ
jgi:hypothetical protein